MKAGILAVAGLAVAALTACKTAPIEAAAPAGSFSFIVIGDVPYSGMDSAMLFGSAVPRIDGQYPFVIHVGDNKSGGALCDGASDQEFNQLLAALKSQPVFYTPGDNEWTDCDRLFNPWELDEKGQAHRYDELKRLTFIRTTFLASPPVGADAMGFARSPAMPELQTWTYDGVRFATLNAVGSSNGLGEAWGDLDKTQASVREREAAAASWLSYVTELAKAEQAKALVIAMQADPVELYDPTQRGVPCDRPSRKKLSCDAHMQLRAQLRDAALAFGGPMLVIHGDTDPFLLTSDFGDVRADKLWRLNATGDVDLEIPGTIEKGYRDVTRVTITPDAPMPFAAEGLTTGVKPGP